MSNPAKRIRLDQFLANQGLASSRSRARDMIMRGCVLVDGAAATKPGTLISKDREIAVDDPADEYVSRAALKLVAGLDAAVIDVKGKNAVDLGASTGGFTQVLLERGAQHVLAVDVGHGQLSNQLSNDPRIAALEGFNARLIDETTPGISECEIVVSDLSFISLTLAAAPALIHASTKAQAVLLVKPQFEVGREGIGKGGLVTDENLIETTNNKLKDWFNSLPGWRLTHFLPSPIKGGDGNTEFLMCGERT